MRRSFEYALVAFFIGVGFVVSANALGVFTFELCWSATGHITACSSDGVSGRKELGFFLALNWSVGLIFLFPMFIYFAAESVNQAVIAIQHAVSRRMIVTSEWVVETEASKVLATIWKRARVLRLCAILVAAIASVFLVAEFLNTIIAYYSTPSLFGALRFPDPSAPVDWTMAGAVCGYLATLEQTCGLPSWSWGLNQVFSALAYFYLPGVGSVLATSFMIGVALFATLFRSVEFTSAGYVLLPDVDSGDPRFGFEIFESFFQHAIIACLSLFAMGYLVALQNIYFQTSDPSILGLIFPKDLSKLFEAIPQLPRNINPRIAAVSILGLFFLFIVVVAAVSALRYAANFGRDYLLEAIAAESPHREKACVQLRIENADELAKRLPPLSGWPLNWPTVLTLIAWLVLATISMLVVSAGLYIIAAGIAYALATAGIQKWLKPTPA
jgi:hypothetical protein